MISYTYAVSIMGVWNSFVGLAVLLQTVNRFAPIDGFGSSCIRATTNPSDSLTIPTCNTSELVFAWNIKQLVYRMSFEYTCINPNGVNISTPSLTTLSNRNDQIGSTTLMGVDETPGATCWFSACYKRSPDLTSVFLVRPTSCVIQDASFTSITSTTSGSIALTTSFQIPYLQVSHTSAYQMQPSQQTQYTLSGTQSSDWLPSSTPGTATSLSRATMLQYADATMLYVDSTVLYTPNVHLESCHTSLWCNRNYIAVSTVAAICLVLILLTVVVICQLMIQQRKVSKRTLDLQSLGCKINEKPDPDFKPRLTSHSIFLSVESQLDSLHKPSPVMEETDCTQSYSDGYSSESICGEYACQTTTSSSGTQSELN